MSLEDKVGQMLVPGFVYHRDGSPVRSVTDGIRSELERVQPGGVLLFGANIDTVEQTRRFVEDLQAAVDPPLFIATDQEGGPVSRLSEGGRIKATEIPSARIVGAVGDPKLAYRLGAVIGRELRALGINMNLAPVADVLTNEKNSVIGNRSYGTDPHAVAEMVSATVRGIQDQGVSAVVKHFPGHGDTTGDSHSERVGTEHTLERLRAVELVPFAAGIDAGADGVMTAHIAVPKITGTTRPATLSPRMLEGVLRAEMGFDRLIISDSMSMAAITGSFGPRESAVLAVKAGVDLLLRPPKPVAAYEALLEALRRGELSRSRIDASVRRILRVKLDRGIISLSGSDARPESSYRPVTARSQGQEPDEVLGSARHERVVEDLMRRYRRRAQQ
jgi:beta-N-acetylhexosaminidase